MIFGVIWAVFRLNKLHCTPPFCRCGPVDFKVEVDPSNKPANILEEIVWYKYTELQRFKQHKSSSTLAVAAAAAPPARDFKGAILQKLQETGRPGVLLSVFVSLPEVPVRSPHTLLDFFAHRNVSGSKHPRDILFDSDFKKKHWLFWLYCAGSDFVSADVLVSSSENKL